MDRSTLGRLLLEYGNLPQQALRQFPGDVRKTAGEAADWVKGLPEQAQWAGEAGLGGLQYLRNMSRPEQRGRAPAFDTANADVVRELAPILARMPIDLAGGVVQNVRNLSPAPFRGTAPAMDTALANAAAAGLRGLPEAAAARPAKALATLASFVNPASLIPSRLRAAEEIAGDAADAARPAYTREQSGPFLHVRRADLEPQRVPGAETASLPELRGMLANPETNPAFRAADAYTRAKFGRGYDLTAPDPGSSLAKQAGIARVFDLAATGDDAYKKAIFERYGETMPEVVEGAKAQNYDQLLEAAYRKLGEETRSQFDVLPVETAFHQGAGEYPRPSAMLQDLMGRGRLNVFQGGERHDFLHDIDPASGLTSNEQFRAAHDVFGHGTRGTTFRPGGEEAAYASHSQMMSPLAQMALAAETRGQNSWVNYGPANADIIREQNRIRQGQELLARAERDWGSSPLMSDATRAAKQADIEEALAALGDPATAAARLRELGAGYQYAPQTGLLLPPEYLPVDTAGGVPDYLKPLITGSSGTAPERGVHFSAKGDLTRTDPGAYGTGHRGAEYNATSSRPRTYFYTGEPGTVVPEQALFNRGSRVPYQGELSGLYPLAEDPDRLLALANAYAPVAKREGQTLSDLEKLVQTYGYQGYKGGHGSQGAAAVFAPVDVSKLGEAISAPRPFAAGGAVSR